MNWNEITVNVSVANVETASAIANMTVPYGIYIEDYSDLEQSAWDIAHIDLIDEELIAKDRNIAKIHIYIPEEENVTESIAFLGQRLEHEKIEFKVETVKVSDKDWNENWKKFFLPTEIGQKLAIVPSWETYENVNGRKILSIDPGAAFGTGTHATTSLCLELLENYVTEGSKMLDVGCGSGFLSIIGLKLGVEKTVGTDIDPNAISATLENCEINGVTTEEYSALQGNLLADDEFKVSLGSHCYDIVVANILADVIIPLSAIAADFLKEDGIFITSGIINTKEEEVKEAMIANGFEILEITRMNDWVSITGKPKK